jgi:hypothetical protein
MSIPLVAVIIITMISKMQFAPSFSPEEQKVFNFTSQQIPKLTQSKEISVSSIKCPIDVSKSSEKGFPKTSLTEMVPPPATTEKRLSFILVNQKRKLAIIDGKLVHEGDVLGDHKIAKIEKNKILLRSREGEKWLKLD